MKPLLTKARGGGWMAQQGAVHVLADTPFEADRTLRLLLDGGMPAGAPLPHKVTRKVETLHGVTGMSLDPARVINGAHAANLVDVIIVGRDADGEFYFASNQPNGPDVLWDLAQAQRRLLAICS